LNYTRMPRGAAIFIVAQADLVVHTFVVGNSIFKLQV